MTTSFLTAAIGELGSGDLRSLLARTARSQVGPAAALRPRLREAVLSDELAPEDVLRRLDEDALLAIWHEGGLEEPRSRKHADLLHALAALIKKETPEPSRRRKRSRDSTAATELEQLREDLDRLLDERAKLEAKVRRLERELEHDHEDPGLDAAPADLGELLRGIGIPDAASFKRLYRPAAKLLHPDKSKEGEPAFRLLTRIRDLLDGRS
jgi:hypothetical protein